MCVDVSYARLKALGLVKGRAQFSTDFLGRSARYYDYLLCSGKPPSIGALASLSAQVQMLARSFGSATTLVEEARELESIADTLWGELERRCVVARPVRRRQSAQKGRAITDSRPAPIWPSRVKPFRVRF